MNKSINALLIGWSNLEHETGLHSSASWLSVERRARKDTGHLISKKKQHI